MEPIDKWKDGYKELFSSTDPATRVSYTWKTFNYSPWMSIEEKKEKTPTLNESRLKPIKL